VTKIPLNRREEKKSKDQQAASKQASKQARKPDDPQHLSNKHIMIAIEGDDKTSVAVAGGLETSSCLRVESPTT
jgi:hypothetical protein